MSALATQQPVIPMVMDRLEAARALLECTTVTPPETATTTAATTPLSSSSPTTPAATASDGLEALALLASRVDDDDEDDLSPPPTRRKRSASCPEGMERWNAIHQQHHYAPVTAWTSPAPTPSSGPPRRLPFKKRATAIVEDDESAARASGGTFEDDSVAAALRMCDLRTAPPPPPTTTITDPADLLRRARARLFHDLAAGDGATDGPNGGGVNGHHGGGKGELRMPHSLDKYKEIYNRNGRVGIYTPDERAAIIARFNSKRSRRVWNKRIRYNCRKDLADRRLRVKGRFVRRTELPPVDEAGSSSASSKTETETEDETPLLDDPTDEQPFRRTRRNTIA